jgi:hypothetical protein
MTAIYATLRDGQKQLAESGLAMLAVLLACLVAMALDPRGINGVSVWTKPAKFALSIMVWLWTLAWAWRLLDPAARTGLVARVVLWGTLAASWFEQGWITLRAALGLPSHFAKDALGAFMFGLMGLAALALVALAGLLGALILWRGDKAAAPRWRLAAGLGLLVTGVLGGVTGFAIGSGGSPRIGGSPTDAGNLPPFFWSRDGGDLRVAHFLAVHAMQALPLLALAGAGIAVIWLGAAGWTAVTLAAFLLARAGVPLSP